MRIKQLFAVVLLSGCTSLLAACHDDFDYDYPTPPVSVTHTASSYANYGDSNASYGNPSNSNASYGSSAPIPPVSVTTNHSRPYSNSNASYGN